MKMGKYAEFLHKCNKYSASMEVQRGKKDYGTVTFCF